MSDDLLDTIDHVLDDYETSPDAMRWTPEPVADGPATFARGGRVFTASIGTSPTDPTAWRPLGGISAMASAVRVAADMVEATFSRTMSWEVTFDAKLHPTALRVMMGPVWARSHPLPLATGPAYRRRSLARKRRNLR